MAKRPARSTTISPEHPAIGEYYSLLQEFRDQRVRHEGAVSGAFENLLSVLAKQRGWIFIPLLAVTGKRIIPDGTIRDGNGLPRGYWEAKDTDDNLDAEIEKKRAKSYPLNNIIFEDTREAVLYQDKAERMRIDLANTGALVRLLQQFFFYIEPDIEGFEAAVDEFKDRVPELATGLLDKIKDASKNNTRFIAAFESFFELCRTSLDPKITVLTVQEMLVQHLLTERLFRTIFDNQEFTQRNVIAREVDQVINALVSKSFSRTDYLKSLDSFYVAIENAARTLPDFSDKQHFLNTVYERFFQGYSTKLADTHGVVYTPATNRRFHVRQRCACAEGALWDHVRLAGPGYSRPVHRHGELRCQSSPARSEAQPPEVLLRAAFRERNHAARVLHRIPQYRARKL